MSWIRRLMGIAVEAGAEPADDAPPASVRLIMSRLEGLEPGHARRVASFAYVMARVAHVDMNVDSDELDAMQKIVAGLGDLPEDEARLVVVLAQAQAEERGASDDYLVTRALRAREDPAERARLVDCAFAIAAADGSISTGESEEALSIAQELGFSRQEALGLRSRWRDKLAELQDWPPRRG